MSEPERTQMPTSDRQKATPIPFDGRIATLTAMSPINQGSLRCPLFAAVPDANSSFSYKDGNPLFTPC